MSRIDPVTSRFVRQRADDRCEYCGVPQSAYSQHFCTNHVIARQHGGVNAVDNLAFCCLDCNLRKGPNIAGIDPVTGGMTPLFHPRYNRWADHFVVREDRLIGITAIGRATVVLLDLNRPERLAVRQMLLAERLWPPP